MEKKYKKFKLGELVRWESQSKGWSTVKSGKVVEVIPPGEKPQMISDIGKLKFDGKSRNHEAYLVEVPHHGKGKPSIYHPRVSQLKNLKDE